MANNSHCLTTDNNIVHKINVRKNVFLILFELSVNDVVNRKQSAYKHTLDRFCNSNATSAVGLVQEPGQKWKPTQFTSQLERGVPVLSGEERDSAKS